jgi:hypothetical protein
MNAPDDATKVFNASVYTGTNTNNRLINTTIAPDMVLIRQRNDTVIPGMYLGTRITGPNVFIMSPENVNTVDNDSFDAQIISSVERGNAWSSMNGVWVGADATRKFNVNTTTNNHIIHSFKRAKGFFDVVRYLGTGTAQNISHNLGASPTLMWVKSENDVGWAVYNLSGYGPHQASSGFLRLDSNAAVAQDSTGVYWNNTNPTSSVFSVGTNNLVNENGTQYIAFLFGSVPGVSHISGYTGNGSNQDVTTGFQPRYLLIKNLTSTGDWFVFDTVRGVSRVLRFNATTAEQTLSPVVITILSNGFNVAQNANTNINVNAQDYLFMAIA